MSARRFLLIAVGAALIAAMCSGAAMAARFSDTFDFYAISALAGQGGWTGSAQVKVETTFVKSVKSVEADFLVWGAGQADHQVSLTSGYYSVDVDVAEDTTSPNVGENLSYIKLFNAGDGEITRIYIAHRQLKVLLAPANQTVIKDNVLPRRWYHVRLGIDRTTSRMDVWVDGAKVISQGLAYGSPSEIAKVVFGQWPGLEAKFTKSETYIDNLVCDGAILSPRFFPGFECNNVFHPFVFYDSAAGHYKMYYAGTSSAQQNDSIWDQWMTGIATSPDTLTWTRKDDDYQPIIRAHRYAEGDVIDPAEASAEFDSIFAIGACVLKDGSTYKAWYTGWNGDFEHVGDGVVNKTDYRIGYATSTDGVAWTKYAGGAGGGSVLGLGPPGAQDAKGVGDPCVLKEGSTYRMWYEGFDGSVWRIFYATSTNGTTWTRQGAALNPGGGALDALGLRGPVVITRNGQYELWYQGRSSSSPNYHIMRATSSNGLTWTKVPGQVALHADDAPEGSESIHVGSIIVQGDNSCKVFFAKESTTTQAVTYGTMYNKNWYIYMETLNP